MSSLTAASLPVSARGRRTRERIMAAAETVFGERGYEAASIAEITRRADVAQGTFYLYFPDKRAAFVGLVEDLGHRLRRELATAVTGAPDRLAVEEAGFRAFFAFVARHRNLYRIVRQAEFVDEATYRRYYAGLAAGYARGLARAMDAGEIRRGEPETLAYALMGVADFIGMRWVLWAGEAPPREVVDEVMALIRDGLRPGRVGSTEQQKGAPSR